METIKPKNEGSVRLFENVFLERLTRTHIGVPLVIFLLYSALLLCWSITHTSLSIVYTIAMFCFGLLSFTWIEYLVHRFVFHHFGDRVKHAKTRYAIHGVHHEFPKDKKRLAMPPVLSITIATLLLFLFRVILGDFVFSFLPGFLTGYAAYLSIHYMVHRFHAPKNFMKALWINHGIHHYRDEEKYFGVSSPVWDYIYGTRLKK